MEKETIGKGGESGTKIEDIFLEILAFIYMLGLIFICGRILF